MNNTKELTEDEIFEMVHSWGKGLSTRLQNRLCRLKLTTKDDAKEAILSGKLFPRSKHYSRFDESGWNLILGYGLKTHTELCLFLGLGLPKQALVSFIVCPHCKKTHEYRNMKLVRGIRQ